MLQKISTPSIVNDKIELTVFGHGWNYYHNIWALY